MKYLITILFMALTFTATGATDCLAGSGKLGRIINATQSDYETVRTAIAADSLADSAKREEISGALGRIKARRAALANLVLKADSLLPMNQRGLFKMLVGDIDQINISLLILILDDKGCAGYLKTGNENLLEGIRGWQEAIGRSIKESKRCIDLAGKAAGPFVLAPYITPVQAH
ncbi:MAG TPA: hypothetical protein VGK71_05490 [Nitrospirota bacterium]|jgi:hypothetical protein